jgi:hypothetical protein
LQSITFYNNNILHSRLDSRCFIVICIFKGFWNFSDIKWNVTKRKGCMLLLICNLPRKKRCPFSTFVALNISKLVGCLRTSGSRYVKTICAKIWTRKHKKLPISEFFTKIAYVQVMNFIPFKVSPLYLEPYLNIGTTNIRFFLP